MTRQSSAYVVGAYEHPTRLAPDKSVAQLHAECALGALNDAGRSLSDVDGYFCAGDAPGASALWMADYLNLSLSWFDGTEAGGCSYLAHIQHAAAAITQTRLSHRGDLQIAAVCDLSTLSQMALSELGIATIIRHPEQLPGLRYMIQSHFSGRG